MANRHTRRSDLKYVTVFGGGALDSQLAIVFGKSANLRTLSPLCQNYGFTKVLPERKMHAFSDEFVGEGQDSVN